MRFIPDYIRSDDQRDVFLSAVLFVSITALIFPYERTLIPEELLFPYTVLKLAPTILSIPFFYFLTRNPYDQKSTFMVFILLSMYSAVGEYFSPLYFYAFILGMLAFTILLRPKLTTILPIVFLGGIPTLYIQHLKGSGILTHARSAVTLDYAFMAAEFIIVILVIFEGYGKRRRKEIQFRERFSIIGLNANAFAHNIKSMLTSQAMLNETLKACLTDPEKASKLLRVNETNLYNIQNYLNEFDVLERTKFESVNVKLALDKVLSLLRISKDSVSIDIKENSLIEILRQDFETILINILLNASKAIEENDQKIEIMADTKEISITYPRDENDPEPSEIGEKIVSNLARKNNILIETESSDSYQVVTLKL